MYRYGYGRYGKPNERTLIEKLAELWLLGIAVAVAVAFVVGFPVIMFMGKGFLGLAVAILLELTIAACCVVGGTR